MDGPRSFWSARRRLLRTAAAFEVGAPGYSRSFAMKLLSILFWGLVVDTAGVSYRCGSMAGLIFFVFTLMIGAVAASHWALQ